MSNKLGLLEEISKRINCEYLSDLRYSFNRFAREQFYLINIESNFFENYSLNELQDAVSYIFFTDKIFADKEGIIRFLNENMEKDIYLRIGKQIINK